MIDTFQRQINYLRISITDRCNLRCIYCMPEEGIELKPHAEILRFEELLRLVKIASSMGISKVRLTGGEPLVRQDVTAFIQDLFQIPGIDDVSLTTNGILLARLGPKLKKAGLKRINISLDTLLPEKYRYITRVGNLNEVWSGIETALDLKFHPVKINTVVMRGINDDEILDFVKLVYSYPVHVRFIEWMPIGESDGWAQKRLIPEAEIKAKIEQHFKLQTDNEVKGSGPAQYYRLPGALGSIGFISAMTAHFCAKCNRLRLTADGGLRPCLFSEKEIDIKGPLRYGASDETLRGLFEEAISRKPKGHSAEMGAWNQPRKMSQIGG